jgi:hypothetical protein
VRRQSWYWPPSAAALPYLAEANARLTEFARDGKGLSFGFAGHVPLSFALANAQGCRLVRPADVRCCLIVRPLALTITVWNNMQSRRLSSTAAPERRRLMSHGQILGFGLVVAFALVAVYPGQALQWRIQSTTKADSLSLAYLLASLRALPGDHSLRLLVTRRLLARGDLHEAELLLQPLLQQDANVPGQFFLRCTVTATRLAYPDDVADP